MDILAIRKTMSEDGIIFSFGGLVSQNILVSIVQTIQEELSLLGVSNNTINAIFIIAIEQMQNIMSYSRDKHIIKDKKHSSAGICVIGFDKLKNKYFVASSNKIGIDNKEKVSSKIDRINSLTKVEQRKYLRDLLRTGQDSHERGAGVGFIEMAKRSSEPLEYKFITFEETDYFEIMVYI